MHNIDLGLIEMTPDVRKYAIARITDTSPPRRKPGDAMAGFIDRIACGRVWRIYERQYGSESFGNGHGHGARFCFINPDTTEQDIQDILQTMR